MKLIRLLQLFALLFATNFLTAAEEQEEPRCYVEDYNVFRLDGRIVVYYEGGLFELSDIHMDGENYHLTGERYYFTKDDIKASLQSLDKGIREEDRKWHHCRKCSMSFRSEYLLDRHMAYDHYHNGARRNRNR